MPPIERPLRPFLWMRARRALDRLRGVGVFEARGEGARYFVDGQLQLIQRIRASLEELQLPALVVRVPNLVERPSWEGEAERFAELLGARFIDGFEAFAALDRREYEQCWLPYDGHWNQRGSDLFAAFMVRQLAQWP